MDPNITALVEQAPFAIAVVHIMEWLKARNWFPWLSANTDKVNRIVAFTVAFLTSLGFLFALQGDAAHGGVLTITIPPAHAIWNAVGRALAQGGIQQWYYHTAVKPDTGPSTAIVDSVMSSVVKALGSQVSRLEEVANGTLTPARPSL